MENKKTPLGKVRKTPHNFQVINFRDLYDRSCTLQQSSVTNCKGLSAIWLGTDDGAFQRMHLDAKQVRALIAVLEVWVKTGEFTED